MFATDVPEGASFHWLASGTVYYTGNRLLNTAGLSLAASTVAGSFTDFTIELALTASGCDQAVVRHKPRLLSDNGSCYIGLLSTSAPAIAVGTILGMSSDCYACHAQSQKHVHRVQEQQPAKTGSFEFLGETTLDYRIGLALPAGSEIGAFLAALSKETNAHAINSRQISLGNGTVTATPPDAIIWTGHTPTELYRVLHFYFGWSQEEDAGVIMTDQAGTELNMIVITREADANVGRHETGIVMQAEDILATEAVFLSVWPTLINEDLDHLEEFAPDMTGKEVLLDPTRHVIIDPLLGVADDTYETVSFIVLGATAVEVMERLLTVPNYIAEDPSYLTFEIDRIEATVLAVSFNTDRGTAIEIRLPLQQKRVAEAQSVLARQNAGTLNAELYYVTQIDDEQEMFKIQKLAPDGALLAPEDLRLVFE